MSKYSYLVLFVGLYIYATAKYAVELATKYVWFEPVCYVLCIVAGVTYMIKDMKENNNVQRKD